MYTLFGTELATGINVYILRCTTKTMHTTFGMVALNETKHNG